MIVDFQTVWLYLIDLFSLYPQRHSHLKLSSFIYIEVFYYNNAKRTHVLRETAQLR